ncbi:MAG TPA: GreA/GreB family elongation factor [Thermoanaerobaculia bacterium]|nr:GreA/GreB family elongation factor [Thermoanaerobaculia bacterium]HXK66940.1 GreA/GreB family elongation factor [Thermoanaerobaculia bacterium]
MEDVELQYLKMLEEKPEDLSSIFSLLLALEGEERKKIPEYISLLDETLATRGNHVSRWEVAKWRLEHAPEGKEDWENIWSHFLECHPGHPVVKDIMAHMKKDYRKSPRKILSTLEELLELTPESIVKFQGKPGKILEFNSNLGVFKVRLDSGQTVSVPLRAATKFLTVLSSGVSTAKSSKEDQRSEILNDPRAYLDSVFRDRDVSVTVDDLRTMLRGLLEDEEIPRWWDDVRKKIPFITIPQGSRHSYRPAKDPEEPLRMAQSMDAKDRLTFINTNLPAFPGLKEGFLSLLRDEMDKSDPVVTYRTWKALQKHSPETAPLIQDIFLSHSPEILYSSLPGYRERLEILPVISDPAVLSKLLMVEAHPDCLKEIWNRLQDEKAADNIFSKPAEAPRAFIFLMNLIGEDPVITDLAGHLTSGLLQAAIEAFTLPAFDTLTTDLGSLWGPEGGAVRLLRGKIRQDEAAEVLEFLDETASRHGGFPQYDAIRAQFLMAFPDLAKSDSALWCTRASLEAKEKEFEQIMRKEIPKARKAVSEAAAMGDLRENFEYKSGRERYEHLQVLAARLRSDLDRVRIIDPPPSPVKEVRVGTRITLENPSGGKRTLTILGPWESDPESDVYSYESELGASLLDKTQGEQVNVLGSLWIITSIDPFEPAG